MVAGLRKRFGALAGADGVSLLALLAVLLVAWHLPVESPRFRGAVEESLALTRWYAREHVVLCLIPAFFIAGAIGAFVSQAAVMHYLGAQARKTVAYGVAATSGTILAVCSCTILPLFAGIWKRGAGLGPASAFLYSGPAINVLAIILTARVLGVELGIARAVFAVAFSVVIGLAMAWLFRAEESERAAAQAAALPPAGPARPLRQTVAMLGAMIGILVFANWGRPADATGLWHAIYACRWGLVAGFGLLLAWGLARWHGARRGEVLAGIAGVAALAALFPHMPLVPFVGAVVAVCAVSTHGDADLRDWMAQSWDFAKKITPLLLVGVLASGFLLGRPGHEGMIPSAWIEQSVGGNSIGANLFASVAGALMYFATLTEVPILQGLMGSGMGKGPALALLLAGPALSLPSMIVIGGVMGARRALAFIGLVVLLAAASGWIFGAFM